MHMSIAKVAKKHSTRKTPQEAIPFRNTSESDDCLKLVQNLPISGARPLSGPFCTGSAPEVFVGLVKFIIFLDSDYEMRVREYSTSECCKQDHSETRNFWQSSPHDKYLLRRR